MPTFCHSTNQSAMILRCIEQPGRSMGEVFNIVETDTLTLRQHIHVMASNQQSPAVTRNQQPATSESAVKWQAGAGRGIFLICLASLSTTSTAGSHDVWTPRAGKRTKPT